jgi:hypothetical protein
MYCKYCSTHDETCTLYTVYILQYVVYMYLPCAEVEIQHVDWLKMAAVQGHVHTLSPWSPRIPWTNSIVLVQIFILRGVTSKISFIWCKLERSCKKGCYWDSYSLSGSFRGWLAPISCLAGRAGQSALYTPTPSYRSYDKGTELHHRTRGGCKKLVRIKLLVDNAYYIIKSIKDKKITKMMKRTADFMVGVVADVSKVRWQSC